MVNGHWSGERGVRLAEWGSRASGTSAAAISVSVKAFRKGGILTFVPFDHRPKPGSASGDEHFCSEECALEC
jgi:hypothetical protein